MVSVSTNNSLGDQIINVSIDHNKIKYFTQVNKFIAQIDIIDKECNFDGNYVNSYYIDPDANLTIIKQQTEPLRIEKLKLFVRLINLAMKVPDMIIVKNCYLAIACNCDSTHDALHAYSKLRSAAEANEDFQTWSISLMRRGDLYIQLQEYKLALRWYKLALKYSWVSKNVEHEIQTYKSIANWYYYMGFLK